MLDCVTPRRCFYLQPSERVKMKTMKIATAIVNAAAASRGFSPEEYISRLASISCGHKMCALLKATEDNGLVSVFTIT